MSILEISKIIDIESDDSTAQTWVNESAEFKWFLTCSKINCSVFTEKLLFTWLYTCNTLSSTVVNIDSFRFFENWLTSQKFSVELLVKGEIEWKKLGLLIHRMWIDT